MDEPVRDEPQESPVPRPEQREQAVEHGHGRDGVQLRDTARFTLTDSRVSDAAAAGVMELTGVSDSTYRSLVVSGNGHGPAAYNGDGLQLSGSRVQVTDVVTRGNGSSPLYDHVRRPARAGRCARRPSRRRAPSRRRPAASSAPRGDGWRVTARGVTGPGRAGAAHASYRGSGGHRCPALPGTPGAGPSVLPCERHASA